MDFSQGFTDKFVKSEFGKISKKSWYKTIYYYTIDSSRTNFQKRLDKFLEEQISNPDIRLVRLAHDFIKYKPDERIVKILEYAVNNIKYSYDKNNWGKVEYWANASETLHKGRDDCDGINAFIYVMARLTGIPSIQIWSCIGQTKLGGHYWNIYYSTQTQQWYAIDGTAWVTFSAIPNRPVFKLDDNKYENIWFVFNDSYIYKY